ncbi:hypothetical protein CBY_1307 [Clostridium butyricum 5521]|nr:hypothetical protein CBY_1307 [Clostridium butyricum 5521]
MGLLELVSGFIKGHTSFIKYIYEKVSPVIIRKLKNIIND